MENRQLLLEIHQMLCKVCNYIDKVESSEFIKQSEEREFTINVAADLFVEALEKKKNLNHDIYN